MVRGILALALLGVLAAGDAVATSGSNLGATNVNGQLSRAVQVGPAFAVEQPAAPSPAQTAPATVTGRATGLGPSTPQPVGLPASTEPAPIPVPQGHRPTCPAGSHLGIMCTAP